jgi:hypothetical protein
MFKKERWCAVNTVHNFMNVIKRTIKVWTCLISDWMYTVMAGSCYIRIICITPFVFVKFQSTLLLKRSYIFCPPPPPPPPPNSFTFFLLQKSCRLKIIILYYCIFCVLLPLAQTSFFVLRISHESLQAAWICCNICILLWNYTAS